MTFCNLEKNVYLCTINTRYHMAFKKSKQKSQPDLFAKGKKSYRYFDNEAIERSQNRRRMETIPWEERKKRNRSNSVRLQGKNVEATIFQYCFLTRNNKTRYRGLFKQTLQALARCAWINMRRLFLFDVNAANLALQKA